LVTSPAAGAPVFCDRPGSSTDARERLLRFLPCAAAPARPARQRLARPGGAGRLFQRPGHAQRRSRRRAPAQPRCPQAAVAGGDAGDFVSLFEKEQAVLGAELVAREEFVLRPGEKRVLTKTLSADTRFIGVLAAFRDLERTRWHVTVPVVPGKKNEVSILLGETVVDAVRTRPKMK
jgi:type VI secretion system (T6SS) VasD/EvfM/TssJ family lipoprotein